MTEPLQPSPSAEGPAPPDKELPEWPPVTTESRQWTPVHTGHISRTQLRRIAGPYQAAVAAPIAHVERLPVAGDVLALAEEATTEIARFDGRVGGLIAPFASVLLRSESAASSKIEKLSASAKAIALAEIGARRTGNAGLIVANTRAMEAAIALADTLDGQAIIAMQEALLGDHDPEFVGGWRGEQVWIGGSDFGPHNAVFIPPHHSRVPADIDDLVAFLARDDLPVLAQAAIAHAQFETIHPFPDGNGRTGRALVHALLRARGVTTNVTIPVSAGLLTDTAAYFDALTSYRDGDPARIVTALAHAAFAAIHNGGLLVDDLREIAESWQQRVKARRDSAVWRIVDDLIAHPALSWSTLEKTFGLASTSAYRAIDHLEDAGVLTELSGKGWGRVWVAPEVLVALDAFAARAGRRNRA
jgi:Fic family protein